MFQEELECEMFKKGLSVRKTYSLMQERNLSFLCPLAGLLDYCQNAHLSTTLVIPAAGKLDAEMLLYLYGLNFVSAWRHIFD